MGHEIKTIFENVRHRMPVLRQSENILRETVVIQGNFYDVGVSYDGSIQMNPQHQPSSLRTDRSLDNESFLVCNEGRCCASLLKGVLQVAWLNRYAPEVYIWERDGSRAKPFVQEPRLENARLIALSMAGESGVRCVATTPTETVIFSCNYFDEIEFEQPNPQLLRPSHSALFSGRAVVLGQTPHMS